MSTPTTLEIEIKLRLESFADYLKLLGSLGQADSEEHHVNAFFDSPDKTLRQNGYALRVRHHGSGGLVTLKSSVSQVEALSVRQEIEAEITSELAWQLIDGEAQLGELENEPVQIVRRQFPGLVLAPFIRFENQRQKVRCHLGDRDLVLEIDKTEFADGSIDYELEVELDDQADYERVRDDLQRMFKSIGIEFENQSASKLARALERFRRTK